MKRGTGPAEIIAATQRLLGEHGIQAITMRQIAAEAQMVVGSTTHHFGNRANLLHVALTQHIEKIEADVDHVISIAASYTNKTTAADTVRDALVRAVGDRTSALIRAELRLDAAREPTHRAIAARLDVAISQLVTELRGYTKHSTDPAAVARVVADLDSAALDVAQTVRAGNFHTAMTARIVELTTPGRR